MFATLRLLSTTAVLFVGTVTPAEPSSSGLAGIFGAAHHYGESVRDGPLARPHPLDGAVGDVIVGVLGSVCTGTPITGTVYVVTAAHCVVTAGGKAVQRSVVRDGVTYLAVAVIVDTDYADHPREEFDAAALVMGRVIPGSSARVGSALPANGLVTLAGYQPVDSDGTLLRGRRSSDHPVPNGATWTRLERPAGCVGSVRSLEESAARVMVPCGLMPGASGGGLYTEQNGELALVGVLSTVTADLSANGIVPLASLHELLEHADRYMHEFPTGHVHRNQSRSPDVNGHGEP